MREENILSYLIFLLFSVDKFEFTRECIVFDLLRMQLFHGWVIDPQDKQLQKIVNSNASSYNKLVEKMIRQRQSNQEELTKESRNEISFYLYEKIKDYY
jgi:hypothetical protein